MRRGPLPPAPFGMDSSFHSRVGSCFLPPGPSSCPAEGRASDRVGISINLLRIKGIARELIKESTQHRRPELLSRSYCTVVVFAANVFRYSYDRIPAKNDIDLDLSTRATPSHTENSRRACALIPVTIEDRHKSNVAQSRSSSKFGRRDGRSSESTTVSGGHYSSAPG